MTFTGRLTRFAGLRDYAKIAIFDGRATHPVAQDCFELLRLADRIGWLGGSKRRIEFALEDVEKVEDELRVALERGSGWMVFTKGSRMIARTTT